MHDVRVYRMGHMWISQCGTCGWFQRNKLEMSATVAADHHVVMNQPNPRDRLVFIRVLIPAYITDQQALEYIVNRVSEQRDLGIIGIPFIA